MISVCILFAVLIRASQSRDIFWVLAWPGTVVHEVLHYTVGFFLGARPTEISVVPNRTESSTIGYVSFDNLNWFNALPTAMAPMLAFPLAWWVSTVVKLEWSLIGVFWVWVVSAVIAQAWPSKVDFAMGTKKIMGVIFWGAVAYLLFAHG